MPTNLADRKMRDVAIAVCECVVPTLGYRHEDLRLFRTNHPRCIMTTNGLYQYWLFAN
jgi:hypothetical protein